MQQHEVTFIFCSISSSNTDDTAAWVQQNGNVGPQGEEKSGIELQPLQELLRGDSLGDMNH